MVTSQKLEVPELRLLFNAGVSKSGVPGHLGNQILCGGT
jgi:hypothetical protein